MESTMLPQELETLVLVATSIAIAVGLLILAFKILRAVIRTLRPAAMVVGFVVIGVVCTNLVQQRLPAQQRDQIEQFFNNLGDQARELIETHAPSSRDEGDEAADDSQTPMPSAEGTPETDMSRFPGGGFPPDLSIPRIELRTREMP